jgi:hypothetical protein
MGLATPSNRCRGAIRDRTVEVWWVIFVRDSAPPPQRLCLQQWKDRMSRHCGPTHARASLRPLPPLGPQRRIRQPVNQPLDESPWVRLCSRTRPNWRTRCLPEPAEFTAFSRQTPWVTPCKKTTPRLRGSRRRPRGVWARGLALAGPPRCRDNAPPDSVGGSLRVVWHPRWLASGHPPKRTEGAGGSPGR